MRVVFNVGGDTAVEAVLCRDLYRDQIVREESGVKSLAFFEESFADDDKPELICPNLTSSLILEDH